MGLKTRNELVKKIRKYGDDENQKSLFFMIMFSMAAARECEDCNESSN